MHLHRYTTVCIALCNIATVYRPVVAYKETKLLEKIYTNRTNRKQIGLYPTNRTITFNPIAIRINTDFLTMIQG